ncbi:ATP-binding protein [Pseudomonas citronellolis]|uniref:ATP-binding protein n=1 Tax=Pseudomonas citronellolis TaxID=53408 RepID=UPI0023E3F376|nr:transporter substrate-binding domain-containing protein [Pseudomonas citronellolis]MDF3933199.1 transporter substrate-binding domain-containing protein [Pseudomonas citronellolis]
MNLARVLILLCSLLPGGFAWAEAQPLTLSGYTAHMPDSWLSPAERVWLSQRGPLRVGVAVVDRPPLQIIGGQRFEGVSADYLGLLAGAYQRVFAYPSRDAALEALRKGEIDLVCGGTASEAETLGLLRSRPYLQDQPVLVSEESRPFDPARQGNTLAVVADYLRLDQVQAAFPHSRLLVFSSTLRALEALSLGNADGMLGDVLSVHYLINMNYLFNLRIDNFAPLESAGFGFLLRPGDEHLLGLIDRALARIEGPRNDEILRRWSAGERLHLADHRVVLTPRENRWVAKHPTVPVVVNRYTGSLAQADASGKVTGITRDYLDLLGQRTGLRFSYAAVDDYVEMEKEMRSGRAWLTPVMPPDQTELNVLPPYLRASVVLITEQANTSIHDLHDLDGKRLSSAGGHYFNRRVMAQVPGIRLVEEKNQPEALQSVVDGRSDAALSSLFTARALLTGEFKGRLKVAAILEDMSTPFGIGVMPDQPELYSILEKAQLTVDPEEVAELVRRWEPRLASSGSDFWSEHRQTILGAGALAALLVLLSLVWGFYLNRQTLRARRAEQRLGEQVKLLNELIEAIPNPVYRLDREGRVGHCNQAMLRLFGCRLEECRGHFIGELGWFPDDEAARLMDEHRQQVATGETPAPGDQVLRLHDGERYVYHWAVAQRDPGGQVQGVIGGWVDLTERQNLVRQLEQERQRADAASAAKSQFLSTMSHEIRTPMNAILGLQELVLEKARDGVLDRDALEVAQDAARSLLMLIGNVLDMARIESGRIDSTPQPALLLREIEGAVALFAGLATQKGLTLDLEAEGELAHWVLLDTLRFKQVLFNLLNNAVKFTAQGSIQVRAQGVRRNAGLELLVEVIDSGVGISAQDQARLFQPFAQAEQGARAQGAGLGLHISRRLAQLMGGEIGLRSEPGQGSRFSLRLPLTLTDAPEDTAPRDAAASEARLGLRVLAVDDHPANRMVFQQQLSHLGHAATLAASGEEALDAWLRGEFQVVLSDCRMAGMDGYELSRRIREEERRQSRGRCLIIGATANAQEKEVELCRAAGMDQVLFKPLTLEVLRQALAAATPVGAANASAAQDTAAPFDLRGLFGADPRANPAGREFVRTLMEANEHDIAELQRLPRSGDLRALGDMAHRLAGAVAIIGAHEAEGHCRALQRICEGDGAGLEACLAQASAALAELQAALRAWLAEAGEGVS